MYQLAVTWRSSSIYTHIDLVFAISNVRDLDKFDKYMEIRILRPISAFSIRSYDSFCPSLCEDTERLRAMQFPNQSISLLIASGLWIALRACLVAFEYPRGTIMRIAHLFDDAEIRSKLLSYEQDAQEKYSRLTNQQKKILDLMVEGHSTKIIAYKLGISTRTAENHRASIMDRTGAKSLVTLVRIYLLSG